MAERNRAVAGGAADMSWTAFILKIVRPCTKKGRRLVSGWELLHASRQRSGRGQRRASGVGRRSAIVVRHAVIDVSFRTLESGT